MIADTASRIAIYENGYMLLELFLVDNSGKVMHVENVFWPIGTDSVPQQAQKFFRKDLLL